MLSNLREKRNSDIYVSVTGCSCFSYVSGIFLEILKFF